MVSTRPAPVPRRRAGWPGRSPRSRGGPSPPRGRGLDVRQRPRRPVPLLPGRGDVDPGPVRQGDRRGQERPGAPGLAAQRPRDAWATARARPSTTRSRSARASTRPSRRSRTRPPTAATASRAPPRERPRAGGSPPPVRAAGGSARSTDRGSPADARGSRNTTPSGSTRIPTRRKGVRAQAPPDRHLGHLGALHRRVPEDRHDGGSVSPSASGAPGVSSVAAVHGRRGGPQRGGPAADPPGARPRDSEVRRDDPRPGRIKPRARDRPAGSSCGGRSRRRSRSSCSPFSRALARFHPHARGWNVRYIRRTASVGRCV